MSQPVPQPASPPGGAPYVPRRATRATDDALIGGVAAGLARHLGVETIWVRLGFLAATVLGGSGLFAYAVLWMMLPGSRSFETSSPGLEAATRQGKRRRRERGSTLADNGLLIALAAVILGLGLLVGTLTGSSALIWPLAILSVGVVVLWRQADEAQRDRWRDTTTRVGPLRAIVGSGGWSSYLRLALGLALLIAAIVLYSLRGGQLVLAQEVAITAVLAVLGVALMLGPWLFRLSSDLTAERTERIRMQERADLAAHLHDSVLQTLALIQKNSADPAAVGRLARAQERELRTWLYDAPDPEAASLSTALKRAAAEVEDDHGVPVDVVCVGDGPAAEPLVRASREAMVNAAKHSGAPRVDVYAEVSDTAMEVFVRDRGHGFDLGTVPGDRLGIRNSIVDRMDRHGGRAEVRSGEGGTEVRLHLDREDSP